MASRDQPHHNLEATDGRMDGGKRLYKVATTSTASSVSGPLAESTRLDSSHKARSGEQTRPMITESLA